jgi:capsular polysaccharide biosynthesis protein
LRFSDEAREARVRQYIAGQRTQPSVKRVILVSLLALLIIAVAAGAAYVVADRMDKSYAARAQLQLIIPTDGSADSASRSLVSQALAVRSRSVLDRTAKATNLSTDELDKRVKSRVLPDSEIIEVDVEDHDPATALTILNQLLSDYLAPAAPQPDSPAAAFITSQIAAVDQQIADVDRRLAALPANSNSRESLQLATERAGLLARRDVLLQNSLELSIRKLSAAEVALLAAPYVLEDPVSPQPIRAAVLAAAVGSIIAASAAYLILRRPALR